MIILSLSWLGSQCPITSELSGIPSDGLQPGKMSRHHFPAEHKTLIFLYFEICCFRPQHLGLFCRSDCKAIIECRFGLRLGI
jgi:hypothetical protein